MKRNKIFLFPVFILLSILMITCVENHVLPDLGKIFITSDPIGADIYLNDEKVGVTPDSLDNILSGDYNISLKKNEFFDSSLVVNISEGQTKNFDVFMKEVSPKGKITLTSEPDGAAIFINNQNTGQKTPYSFSNLERGTYNVKLSLNLYDDSIFDVNLDKDETVQKNTKMIIAGTAGALLLNSSPRGATIFLDGFNTGEITPDTIKPLAAGNYTIKLTLNNYKDTTFSVNVTSGNIVSKDVNLKAIFNINTSSNPTNGGTITGDGQFVQGAIVKLKATPNTGYRFVNWTESSQVVSSDSIYSFNASKNRTIVANFELLTFSISASANPAQGGNTTGSGSYKYGQTANLSATPNTGFTFVNWTENGNSVSNNSNYSFTVNDNRNLVANFSINNYIITTSSNPEEGGTTSGGGGFDFGDQVTVIATPSAGYSFVNWTENGTEISTELSYVFSANKSRNLIANFLINNYTITTSADPTAGGTVSGGGNYNYGTEINLVATPNYGYSFVNWTENGSEISVNTTLPITVQSDRDFVANFIENGNINVDSDPQGASILLNSNNTGQETPYTIENLKEGSYSVTLKLDDFADTTISTNVVSGQTTNLGSIYMRDTTSNVDVEITYQINQENNRITFYFKFNQDIRFNKVDITDPDNSFLSWPFGNIIYYENGFLANVGLAQAKTGNWHFVCYGTKVGGRQQSFQVTKNVSVQ